MNVSEVFDAVMRLGEKLQLSNLSDLDGCWEYDLGDGWWMALNPHSKPTRTTGGAAIPPFNAMVERDGWPAALVSPVGGSVVGGTTEEEIVQAIERAIERAGE